MGQGTLVWMRDGVAQADIPSAARFYDFETRGYLEQAYQTGATGVQLGPHVFKFANGPEAPTMLHGDRDSANADAPAPVVLRRLRFDQLSEDDKLEFLLAAMAEDGAAIRKCVEQFSFLDEDGQRSRKAPRSITYAEWLEVHRMLDLQL